jgi:hypothetical protein
MNELEFLIGLFIFIIIIINRCQRNPSRRKSNILFEFSSNKKLQEECFLQENKLLSHNMALLKLEL